MAHLEEVKVFVKLLSDRMSSFNIAVQFHHWRTKNFNSIQNSVPNYSNANYVPLQLDHFLTFTY